MLRNVGTMMMNTARIRVLSEITNAVDEKDYKEIDIDADHKMFS